jgi:hypothetical protein
MTDVGSTAAAQELERRKLAAKGDVPFGEVTRVARIELFGLVELAMAEGGSVGAETCDPSA